MTFMEVEETENVHLEDGVGDDVGHVQEQEAVEDVADRRYGAVDVDEDIGFGKNWNKGGDLSDKDNGRDEDGDCKQGDISYF